MLFGLNQIILTNKCGDVYNPKVVRSTMGSIFRQKIIIQENLIETISELKEKGFQIVATDLNTKSSMYDIDYTKTAIIIGNEANGVSDEILAISQKRIKIPMLGKAESLNASVATGVILYEILRRKYVKKKE